MTEWFVFHGTASSACECGVCHKTFPNQSKIFEHFHEEHEEDLIEE